MEVLFKKIAVEQLSNLLSEYVVGLDHQKLNAASDSVTLKGLQLKENDLPGVGLRVKGGYLPRATVLSLGVRARACTVDHGSGWSEQVH